VIPARVRRLRLNGRGATTLGGARPRASSMPGLLHYYVAIDPVDGQLTEVSV
jgi:hypothetical protein